MNVTKTYFLTWNDTILFIVKLSEYILILIILDTGVPVMLILLVLMKINDTHVGNIIYFMLVKGPKKTLGAQTNMQSLDYSKLNIWKHNETNYCHA